MQERSPGLDETSFAVVDVETTGVDPPTTPSIRHAVATQLHRRRSIARAAGA
jgi:DNA polymerase III epsilon subunit-like protein